MAIIEYPMPKPPAERRKASDKRRRDKFQELGKKQISAWLSPEAVAVLDEFSRRYGLNRHAALDAILCGLAGHEKIPVPKKAPKDKKTKKPETNDFKDLFNE
jgi:hypothetical protein